MAPTPVRRGDVICRQVDSDTLLFDPLDQRVHILNATAALVWELADGTRDLPTIANALAQSFEVPGDSTVEADVAAVVADLRALNLLQVA